jgi:hypothetical protein
MVIPLPLIYPTSCAGEGNETDIRRKRTVVEGKIAFITGKIYYYRADCLKVHIFYRVGGVGITKVYGASQSKFSPVIKNYVLRN